MQCNRVGLVISSFDRRGSFSNLLEVQDQVQEQLHVAHQMEQQMLEEEQGAAGGETLSNILTIAEHQEAAMSNYYTNEEREILT